MILYRLSYVDDNGKHLNKIIELNDKSQLQSYLRATELNISKIEPLPYYYKFLNFRRLVGKINKKQVIEILENLNVAAGAGVPVNIALLDMAKSSDNTVMGDMLTDISYRMYMSMSLSEAMEKYVGIFGSTVLGLVKIGEETGELDKTLKGAAKYLSRIDKMGAKIKTALIIPAVTLAVMLTAMLFWMVVVMPSLQQLFDMLNVKMPAMTTIFLQGSNIVAANGFYILLAAVCAVIVYIAGRNRSERFLYNTDNFYLKLPVFGRLLKYYNFAFIAEYTRLMISSGVPLFRALGILADTLKNAVFIRGITNTQNLAGAGKSFSEALSEQKLFTPMIIRMIAVGEQTGELEGQLEYVSDYYYDKVDYMSANIAQIIQPVLILFLAVFFVFMILSFLFPIYDMISTLAGSM